VSISFRSKVIQHFRLGLKFPWGPKFWRVLGLLYPFVHAYINETPKKAPSCVKPRRFKPSCMFVRRSVRSLRDCEKKIEKNKIKKNVKIKKSQSRYISRMRGGRPYTTDRNGSLQIGLGQQRYQSCKFLCLSVKGFGLYKGSNIGFFHRKLTWPLQHCLTLSRWHVI
jgi:hypothetical protein